MVALTNYSDMVRTAIEEGIDIIFSGAGLPLDLPKYLPPKAKTKLVPIISSAMCCDDPDAKNGIRTIIIIPMHLLWKAPKPAGI